MVHFVKFSKNIEILILIKINNLNSIFLIIILSRQLFHWYKLLFCGIKKTRFWCKTEWNH